MDAEKIQIERSQSDQRRDSIVAQRILIFFDRSGQSRFDLIRRHRLETDSRGTVCIGLDNVASRLFELARVPDIGTDQSMKSANRFDRKWEFVRLSMDQVKGFAITADFFFVTVSQIGVFILTSSIFRSLVAS